MSEDNVLRLIAQYAQQFPPLITLAEAVVIARDDTPDTIYQWSAGGRFDEFKSKPGKYVLLDRDSFVRFLATQNLDRESKPRGRAKEDSIQLPLKQSDRDTQSQKGTTNAS